MSLLSISSRCKKQMTFSGQYRLKGHLLNANRPGGYKTFFILNSTEHGISNAHKI